MRFHSIKSRVLFWFIGVLSITLLLFSFLLYFLLEKNIHNDIRISLQEKAAFIKTQLITHLDTLEEGAYNDILNIEFIILKNQILG